jgi:hypothetical protein
VFKKCGNISLLLNLNYSAISIYKEEMEGLRMRNKATVFLLIPLIIFLLYSQSNALLNFEEKKILQIEDSPMDVAISSDGKWIFVLTDQGRVLVYAVDGTLMEEITVGKEVDGINVGPWTDVLFLNSSKDKKVRIITLEFLHEFHFSDSPFKGPFDAPVVITAFMDFQ